MTSRWRFLLGASATIVVAASALVGQTLPAVAQAETVKVTGKWKIIPSAAGTYRLAVACPAHTRPESASVAFHEERRHGRSYRTGPRRGFVPLPEGVWPRRVVGGSLGQSGDTVISAKLIVERGPRLKARVTARCHVVHGSR